MEDEGESSLNLNADDLGWKVFGGYRFLKFFGLEGGYQSFGSPNSSLAGNAAERDVAGIDAYALGILPIRKLDLFAKVGLIYWDLDRSETLDGVETSGGDNGIDLAYGVGAAWNFTGHFALRGEYEVFDIEGVDELTFFSVGVDFRF